MIAVAGNLLGRRIEEDHGSRVTAFRESQVILGRRGAAAIAPRQQATLILGPSNGGSMRTRSRRPSPWLWMSKTSPGLAVGRTTRRLASTVDFGMVRLSHQAPASAIRGLEGCEGGTRDLCGE